MASKKQPIVTFKDYEEFIKCAYEWVDILGLNNWLFEFRLINNKEIGKTKAGASELGICCFNTSDNLAVISIANGEGSIAEFNLVHELLHCLLEYGNCDPVDSDEQDDYVNFYQRSIHSRLNQMAKSLLRTKYPSITNNFFRIELDGFIAHMEREELERQDCAMCCDCTKSSKGMRYNG